MFLCALDGKLYSDDAVPIHIILKQKEVYGTEKEVKLDCCCLCYGLINTKYKDEDTIFYLYEPLWNVGTKEESRGIYSKVFNNLKNTFSTNGKNLYIVYISGISRKDIDVEYLKQYGFTTEIFNKQIGSLFLYRNILIYKFHM